MLKKTFIMVLVLLILSMGVLVFAGEDVVKSYGNEFKIDSNDEFNVGEELSNVKVEKGSIKLNDVEEDGGYGEYISQIIDVPAFEYMVVSWNSDTPEGTWIEVQAKVLVNPIETWTDWLSWGQWSPFIQRASDDTEDKLAKISTDELIIKGKDGETADKVQLKVILHSDNSNTPVIRMLHGTLRNTLEGQAIDKAIDPNDVPNYDMYIETPKISQMIRDPKIANIICSPTTITMIMNSNGEKLLPEEVAQNTYDFNYGFGNWAFAMASVGSYGYEAYVDYTTIEGLKREIAQGYPVGVSVRYSNDPKKSSLPYIEGAPGITNGHLIVVTGFETDDDGNEYVLVNDSYAPDNETVSRRYKLDQFEAAWTKKVAYIVHEKEAGAGYAHTKRIDADFETTKKPNAFQIMVQGEIFNIDYFDGTVAYTTVNDEINFNEIEYNYVEKYKNIDNSLKFTGKELSAPLTVYVITDYGYVYVIKH